MQVASYWKERGRRDRIQYTVSGEIIDNGKWSHGEKRGGRGGRAGARNGIVGGA